MAVFDAQGGCHRQRCRARVAEMLERGIVDPLLQAERLEQQPMMGSGRPDGKTSFGCRRRPSPFLRETRRTRSCGGHALAHQRLGIGRTSTVAGGRARSCPSPSPALSPWPPRQFAMVGGRLHYAAQQTVARAGSTSRSQSTMAALPEPIVNEAKAVLMSLRVSEASALRWGIVASTAPRLHSVPTTTPARIWPELDHVGHLDHAVEQAQAGVRHVVDGAAIGQSPGGDAHHRRWPARGNRGRPSRGPGSRRVAGRCPQCGGPFRPSRRSFAGRTSRGQNRRSAMPVMSSSRPSGSRSRV